MLIQVGDRSVMRKVHACGGNEWEITRTGADVGLRCIKCGHKIMLERSKFERAVKTVLPKAQAADSIETTDGHR